MTERPEHLPDYSHPPVHEVVAGVQFDSLPLELIDFGRLWERFLPRYRTQSAQMPLDPVFETFVQRASRKSLRPQIQVMDRLELPRAWFISEDESDLLQIQRDRLIHNWRKRSGGTTYPHFESVLAELFRDVETVRSFFRETKEGWSDFEVNQCEVVYVNHIPSNGMRCGEIFSVWNTDCVLGDFERGSMNITSVIRRGENPTARLRVDIKPLMDENDALIWQLSLTYRGSPQEPTWESAAETLKEGREHIVQNFTNLTTAKMHTAWGRKR
ncbi:MAG: TIGR04255 family protein [Tistlia sp.]|uniref:TIGR04255 family protein n=1 Tax=Tistlia sp. TaxID=3057121 RepID=UPI0034A39964